jgi:hypothetical protein
MSSFKNTSKIQIIDPSPFLSKHINEIKLNKDIEVSYKPADQQTTFESPIALNHSQIHTGDLPKKSFLNYASHKKYLTERYSKLSDEKKTQLLILLGVLSSFLVVLFILLILFATGE